MSPLCHRATRATEPQHDADALAIQQALLASPGYRGNRKHLTPAEFRFVAALLLFVVIGGVLLGVMTA